MWSWRVFVEIKSKMTENNRKCMTSLDQNSLWSHLKYQVPSQKSLNSLSSPTLYKTVEVSQQKFILGPSWLASPPPSFYDFWNFLVFESLAFYFHQQWIKYLHIDHSEHTDTQDKDHTSIFYPQHWISDSPILHRSLKVFERIDFFITLETFY